MTAGRASSLRRIVGLAVLAAGITLGTGGIAMAACKMTDVTGQWQNHGDNSHWVFFSNQRVDCRVCMGWNGGCRYVPDPTDKLGRKQCLLRKPGDASGEATIAVTGWEAENGELARIVYSDGSKRDVRNACNIDRGEGLMLIEGIGRFECHYNYQCNKIKNPS